MQSKSLLIDYRLDGKPFRLLLEEQYPVAFTINLPAPDAAPPGADSRAAELAAEAALRAKAMPPPRVHLDSPPGNWERYKEYLPLFASLVAIIFSLIAILCAGAAFFQIRQVKKQQPKA